MNIFTIPFYDYSAQPLKVTINNIIKELPGGYELLTTDFIKSYLIASTEFTLAPIFKFNIKTLKDDTNYFGSFYFNAVSAFKHTALWFFGVSHGTREYEYYRPFTDLLKLTCKVSLLSQSADPFTSNLICELPSSYYLSAMEVFKNTEQNPYHLSSWYEVSTPYLLCNTFRKALISSIIGKYVGDYLLKPYLFEPVATYVTPLIPIEAQYLLSFTTSLPVPNAAWKIVVLPSPELMLKELVNIYTISSIARFFIYSINYKQKALFEYNGEISCKKIGAIFYLKDEHKIEIEYKYDALKLHHPQNISEGYHCQNAKSTTLFTGNITTYIDDNRMIVHYPESDNYVDWALELIGV